MKDRVCSIGQLPRLTNDVMTAPACGQEFDWTTNIRLHSRTMRRRLIEMQVLGFSRLLTSRTSTARTLNPRSD